MGYKASGKIVKIFDTEQKSASFQAREFVIEVADGQYPQMVKFQLVQDKCCLLYTSPSPRDATLSRMPSSA